MNPSQINSNYSLGSVKEAIQKNQLLAAAMAKGDAAGAACYTLDVEFMAPASALYRASIYRLPLQEDILHRALLDLK